MYDFGTYLGICLCSFGTDLGICLCGFGTDLGIWWYFRGNLVVLSNADYQYFKSFFGNFVVLSWEFDGNLKRWFSELWNCGFGTLKGFSKV